MTQRNMTQKYYYEVALPLFLKKNLIYSSNDLFQPGESVLVPLKGTQKSGVILRQQNLKSLKTSFKIKAIISKDPEQAPLSSARMKWLLWLSNYYQHPAGSVVHLSFPPHNPRPRSAPPPAPPSRGGTSSLTYQPASSLKKSQSTVIPPLVSNPRSGGISTHAVELTEEQRECLQRLTFQKERSKKGVTACNPPCGGGTASLTYQPASSLKKSQSTVIPPLVSNPRSGFCVHLLHGETGSGKTEIFFRLIEPFVKKNKSVLVLVPEIALTPQHIERFSERFPHQVACLHSGLTPKEKRTQWRSVVSGEKHILIGPRSALFCPLPQLSWIIVDEEHESHFKQEEKLKYHARDSAVYLAKCLNIPILLASATPSIESQWNALKGKYIYHRLKNRVFNTPPPKIQVVDMKGGLRGLRPLLTHESSSLKKSQSTVIPPLVSKPRSGQNFWLSRPLYSALKDSLEKKEQSALFINRRGESPFVFCPLCAYHFSCVNCDIALTQHQSSHLLCHYCGFRCEKPALCPQCKEGELFSAGVGTAEVEKEVKKLFPKAVVVRVDRDEIKTHKQWAELLVKIEENKVDILIGTQMIAKGLDFPYLNLVGLIYADQGLNRPDFRASERSFQLMTQMAGRAGRRKTPGRVILQSYNPSHPVIKAIEKGDYEVFFKKELRHRKKYLYPPFAKLTLVRAQSLSSARARKALLQIKEQVKNIKNLTVLGPAPAPYFRLRNKYRFHLLLKGQTQKTLEKADSLIFQHSPPPLVQIHINKDPIYML